MAKPTIHGELGFFYHGASGKWIHDGEDWVPWALITSSQSTGLEKLTEDGKTGWRLVGKPADKHGMGDNAVDFSVSTTVGDNGVTGYAAVAFGLNVKASGDYSFAGGEGSIASSGITMAFGYQAIASGNTSMAIGGGDPQAIGNQSIAMGNHSRSNGLWSVAIGPSAESIGDAGVALGPGTKTDASHNYSAFGVANTSLSGAKVEIGIGSVTGTYSNVAISRKNGLEIFDDGSLNAPEASIQDIVDRGDKALITVEYGNTHYNAQAISGTIDVTYAELKAKHDSSSFVTGQSYKITDFRSLWYVADFLHEHVSDWGTWVGVPSVVATYGITLKIEPLIVVAATTSELQENAKSEDYPAHIITYRPMWEGQESKDTSFPTAAATTEFRGAIVYREDEYLDISAKYDYMAVQNIRWTASTALWDVGVTYEEGQPAELADGTGNGQYVSLHDGNVGHSPDEVDSEWWMVIREKGVNENYRDYWISSRSTADTDPWLTRLFFGLTPNYSEFKLFYTFAMVYDLTIASGGYGSWASWYYHSHVKEHSNIVLLQSAGEATNIFMDSFGADVSHTTLNGRLRHFKVETSLRVAFIYGDIISSGFTKGYSYGVRIGGMNNTFVNGSMKYSLLRMQGTQNGNVTALLGTKIDYMNTSRINAKTAVENCTFDVENCIVTGNLRNVGMKRVTGSVFYGDMYNTEISHWTDVTLPKGKTLDSVVFLIPSLSDKFIWDANTTTYKDLIADRKYSDDSDNPTIEKVWYNTVDVNGMLTYKELK